MNLQLLFHIILLSWPIITSAQASTKPNCQSSCGNVNIPFPFGIGPDCYIDHWFAIDCNSAVPILSSVNLEVLELSLNGTMRVNHPVFSSCKDTLASINVNLAESPFVFSEARNRFTGVGCNNFAFMSSTVSVIGGCLSVCGENSTTIGENSCYGIECCQTSIPSSLQIFNASIRGINDEADDQQVCKYAFLVEQQWFETNLKSPQDVQKYKHVPVVVEWGIQDFSFNLYARNKSTSYNSTSSCEISSNATSTTPFQNIQCKCSNGFEGNPYLLEGYIDECNTPVCGTMDCQNLEGSFVCYTPRSCNWGRRLGMFVFTYWGMVAVHLNEEKKRDQAQREVLSKEWWSTFTTTVDIF
ncbi:hypothetical protein Pint_07542 [Pistacia integerrima]|uniref:Uncharacterized protein n=1 Tax=Pistacia integerrima TaxID=434235 RepID=A0ACC0Y0B2_9ROSI|nr:hypothetical protein Pint_07542 [Pistacia integerrima]